MMAPMAARLGAVVILIAFGLAVPCLADAPKFSPPLDNAVLSADVKIGAEKKHLDGNDRGYVSFRIVRQGEKPDKIPFVVAVVYPFEYRWNTQETYWNQADAYDPLNGSRKYPDGTYTVTAIAFDAAGKQLGDPATATVRVANNIPQGGKVLLETGSFSGQELRYKATGSLYARMTAEEEDKLDQPVIPPMVQMKMESAWTVDVRKPLGLSETEDGRRWHGQFYPQAILGPDGRVIMTRWDNVRYAVQDAHIESGWVELLGGASPEQYVDWLSAGGMSLPNVQATLLDLPGTGGAAAGAVAGAGGEPGGAPGAEPGGQGVSGGEQPGGAGGVGGAGPVAAATGGTGAGIRGQHLMPVNLPGLGSKFRSIMLSNGAVGKMRREDPRWPLAEIWTQLPSQPVGVGDSWSGDMTLLPFFDEQYHMHAHGGGGYAAWGPNHTEPLYNRYYSGKFESSTNEGYGPGNASVIHVLDGFEYYKGYECARIVSRFRNYSDTEAWRRDYKTGWWLADLNPRMFGIGQAAGGFADTVPIMRTDLTRVTYFAFRSGHVVGIEDHYRHQLWLNKAGFQALSATRRFQRTLPGYDALLALAGQLGLPGASTGAAGAAAGGVQPGEGMGMPGGEAMGMPGPEGAAAGGAAASTGRPGWSVDGKRGLFGAPAGGGGAAAAAAGGAAGGELGMEGMGPETMGGEPETRMGPAAGGGAAAGGARVETMCDAVAQVVITILEQGGSDERNARPRIQYAAMPPAGQALTPPGAALSTRNLTRRYVVVESTGLFYDPASPLLVNLQGVTVDTSADRLIAMGFRPAPDLKF